MSDAAATAPPTAKKPARTKQRKQRSHPVDGRLSAQVGNPAGVILKISLGFWKLRAVGRDVLVAYIISPVILVYNESL